MQFDLFTFVASLFNFLVLLLLLRIFLFKRVVAAMDARETRLTNTWDEAEQTKAEADELRDEYAQRMQDIDQKREEILDEARSQADRERKSLLEEARQEVQRKREEWMDSLRDDQQKLVRAVREEVTQTAITSARSILQGLAGAGLETAMIDRLIEELSDEGDPAEMLRGAVVEIATSRDLDEDERSRIRTRLEFAEPESVDFSRADGLICGLRMRLGDHEISWSAADRVADVEAAVTGLLETG